MQPVHLNPIYKASAERLFEAWTSPRLMREWLFKGPINRIEHIERDLVVGGSFSILEDADGRKINHFGEYTEIASPPGSRCSTFHGQRRYRHLIASDERRLRDGFS
jgi:uncharacterized protein YndB with AHSA1/START domain